MRILVVDDARENIRILASALKQDYRVVFALNGEDALRMAEAEPMPDLILLDIQLPGIDGYEVCRRLKASPRTENIPIIFITSLTDVEDETRGLEMGAVDYITKPFRLPIVCARVKTHLELKRHRDLLEQLSTVDGLTGVANRRRFEEVLAIEWRRAAREAVPLSVIMLDIDHFKNYNDAYGHPAGDECLKRVAATLADCIRRAADTIARYGGEEFVAVLPNTNLRGATIVADAMRNAVRGLAIPHEHSTAGPHVTITAGVSTIIPPRRSPPGPDALVQAADRALYDAKRTGRDRTHAQPLETPDA